MTPIAIKKYLAEKKMATLHEITTHFRMETNAITPMLELLTRKGVIIKHVAQSGCSKGCCHCEHGTTQIYETCAP
ncbi:MAG: hypothetical protein B6I36_00120 [Desulfobacteraceae bacterium 4572_35.1]|nr:MAG: hypothetical protein B6I36_00120 [Desulfobacteraceae bacterium 4572_35.1]